MIGLVVIIFCLHVGLSILVHMRDDFTSIQDDAISSLALIVPNIILIKFISQHLETCLRLQIHATALICFVLTVIVNHTNSKTVIQKYGYYNQYTVVLNPPHAKAFLIRAVFCC